MGLLDQFTSSEMGQGLLGTTPEAQRASLSRISASLLAPMQRGETFAGRLMGGIATAQEGRQELALKKQEMADKRVATVMGMIPKGQQLTPESKEMVAQYLKTGDSQYLLGLSFTGGEATRTTQMTGAELNKLFGTKMDEDRLFNVDPKGKITGIGGGGTSVSVTTGPQVGTIPAGYQLAQDPETGALSMSPIAGGPVEQEEAAQEKRDEIIARSKEVASDVVNTNIGRLKELIDKDSLTTPVTGVTGWVASFIPSTVRSDAEALANTIKANVGFDKLQSMRDASPTGGALGQVSEKENVYLQSTLGNLEFSQSKEQLLENLKLVEAAYNRIVHGIGPDIPEIHGDVLGILGE